METRINIGTGLTQSRWILILVGVLCLAVMLPGGDKAKQVAIVARLDVLPNQELIEGFEAALKESAIVYHLEKYDVKSGANEIVNRLRQQKPDIIVTSGTSVTQEIAVAFPNVPVVYTMVMLQNNRAISPRQLVGISLSIPVEIQLERIKSILPAVKRVGIIYNPEENELLVQQAKGVADKMGLTLVTYPVSSEKEIPNMGDLKIDILWLIPDMMVCRFPIFRQFVLDGVRLKIPVMAFTASYARSGALMSLSFNYKDIGRQSGELVVRFLKGEPYEKLATTIPRKFDLYLNQIVAKQLGICFPDKIVHQAVEVFEE